MQVTYFQDKDFYYFKVPYHQRSTILVDGKSLPQDTPYSKEIEVTSKTLPKIELVDTRTIVVAYKDSKGTEITPEEYAGVVVLLTQGAVTDEDSDELLFDDLDEEYKYKKFVREYQAVYGTTRTITEVKTVVVTAMMDTGSPYLTAVFRTDSNNPHLVSYNQAQHQLDVVRTWAKTNQVQVDIPTHSHLRYAKVNGKYVFDTTYEKVTPELLTFAEANAHMQEVEQKVKSCLNSAIITADSVTLADLLIKIRAMKANTDYLTGPKATATALRGIRAQLNVMQKELEELTRKPNV